MTPKSPALLDLFVSSKASICSTMAFPPLGSFDHVAVLDFVDFQTNLKQDALLHCIAYFVLYWIAILVLIGMVFVII